MCSLRRANCGVRQTISGSPAIACSLSETEEQSSRLLVEPERWSGWSDFSGMSGELTGAIAVFGFFCVYAESPSRVHGYDELHRCPLWFRNLTNLTRPQIDGAGICQAGSSLTGQIIVPLRLVGSKSTTAFFARKYAEGVGRSRR